MTCCARRLAHRPDLLVADINMPPGHGDDGLVAAHRGAWRGGPRSACSCSRSTTRSATPVELLGRRRGGRRLPPQGARRRRRAVHRRGRAAWPTGGSALDPEVVGRMLGRRRDEQSARPSSAPGSARSSRRWRRASRTEGIAEELVVTDGRRGEAHHPDLQQARDRRRRHRASARARRPHVPPRSLTRRAIAEASTSVFVRNPMAGLALISSANSSSAWADMRITSAPAASDSLEATAKPLVVADVDVHQDDVRP